MLVLNYLLQLQKINIIKIFLIVYEYYYLYERKFDWIEFAFALLYECLISFYFIKKFDEDIKEMNEKDKK